MVHDLKQPYHNFSQFCEAGTGTATFYLSGTGMHYGSCSRTGFESGSNLLPTLKRQDCAIILLLENGDKYCPIPEQETKFSKVGTGTVTNH